MKRILIALAAFLLVLSGASAQNGASSKRVESNLMFNSGTFYEVGSCNSNINWNSFSHNGFSPIHLLLPGHVFRISYGLDFRMNDRWSLMPGVGLRAQTASLIGMFAIGGDVDVMAAADVFCALRYHLQAGNCRIIFGLGPDVSYLTKSTYYIDADPSDPRNREQKFYRFDYGLQPSVTFRMGKHWQWGLEANFGLRNMRIPYEFTYSPFGDTDAIAHVSVKGSTYLHTVALTCGFNF